jgi:SAM-dependent methyltransferase
MMRHRPTAGRDTKAAEEFRSRGQRFTSRALVQNYLFRPPYSREVYATLLGLIRDQPRAVLDAGCGPGKIAIGLMDAVDRVDAVDPSFAMIRVGRSLRGGNNPKIRWLCDTIEHVALRPPYALVVAGASFHWMKPDAMLRRCAEVLSENGVLAVLDGDSPIGAPWEGEEEALAIDLVSRTDNRAAKWWKTASERLADPLVNHPWFPTAGSRVTAPMPFKQSIPDYLKCLHSRQAFSIDHVGSELCDRFDQAMTRMLSRYAVNGVLSFDVRTRIEWARPTPT